MSVYIQNGTLPTENFTRPNPTRDNDDPDPTRPVGNGSGRVRFTHGYG